MKEFFTNLALFSFFAIAFSGLNSCTATQPNAGTDNAVTKTTNTKTQTNETKAPNYPPLPVGIADASVELLDGTITKVSDHKGKVILLNLWATWCGPCVAEMPAFEQMQARYKDQGFEVIGLNIGNQAGPSESIDTIKSFAEKHRITYALGRIDRAMTSQFYLVTKQEVIPQSFIVSKDGHLRAAFAGGGPKIVSLINETVEKAITE